MNYPVLKCVYILGDPLRVKHYITAALVSPGRWSLAVMGSGPSGAAALRPLPGPMETDPAPVAKDVPLAPSKGRASVPAAALSLSAPFVLKRLSCFLFLIFCCLWPFPFLLRLPRRFLLSSRCSVSSARLCLHLRRGGRAQSPRYLLCPEPEALLGIK